jgi:hypothetical protein
MHGGTGQGYTQPASSHGLLKGRTLRGGGCVSPGSPTPCMAWPLWFPLPRGRGWGFTRGGSHPWPNAAWGEGQVEVEGQIVRDMTAMQTLGFAF